MPWVKIADATESGTRYISKTNEYIRLEGVSKSVVVKPGTLILSNSGTAGLPMFIGIEACIHDGWQIFDDFNGIDKFFLYYELLFIRDRLLHDAYDSTMKNLTLDMVRNANIALPPIGEQKAIAATLSCLDEKIELNNRINKTLEKMAQAIFKSWFVDFEPFQDGEFEDSELGRIPKGWRVGIVSDLGNVIGGSTPSKACSEYYTDEGIAWITPKDLSVNKNKFISKGLIDITELGLKNSSTKIMPKGTVLFSSRAPIGYLAISKNDVTTNQGFKSVVPYKNTGTAYVYYFLKNNVEIIENRASGSTFKEVSGTIMKQIPALIPDDKTLQEFQKSCNLIFEKQMLLESQNQHLSVIRDALLPKLMSGEIRVPTEEVQ
jgi:type I restriction enzyme S subunit